MLGKHRREEMIWDRLKQTTLYLKPFAMSGLIIISGLLLIIGLALRLFQPTDWTLDVINRGFTIPIPSSATHIHYEGHRDRGGFLKLTFVAPAGEAATFARQFCDEPLYPRYDPFDAIEVAEPFTDTLEIETSGYAHYVKVNQTSPTILGTKCEDSSGQVKIRLDTTDPHLQPVTFERRFSCYDVCRTLPLNIVYPFSDAPIELLGVTVDEDKSILTSSEICIGFSLKSITEQMKFPGYINRYFSVMLGNQLVASGRINQNGTITDRMNGVLEPNNDQKTRRSYYDCFVANGQKGDRRLQVKVWLDGSSYSEYWIPFLVE